MVDAGRCGWSYSTVPHCRRARYPYCESARQELGEMMSEKKEERDAYEHINVNGIGSNENFRPLSIGRLRRNTQTGTNGKPNLRAINRR